MHNSTCPGMWVFIFACVHAYMYLDAGKPRHILWNVQTMLCLCSQVWDCIYKRAVRVHAYTFCKNLRLHPGMFHVNNVQCLSKQSPAPALNTMFMQRPVPAVDCLNAV